ncbi:MAG: hypothetical protein WCA27_16665 [Candidatus Sulfotelmatobacter sp.]
MLRFASTTPTQGTVTLPLRVVRNGEVDGDLGAAVGGFLGEDNYAGAEVEHFLGIVGDEGDRDVDVGQSWRIGRCMSLRVPGSSALKASSRRRMRAGW